MLRLQLAIVYCSSGIEKSLNEQWWSGEAVWRSLTLPVFAQLDVAWLAQVPRFAQLAGWGVLAVETFHPLFLYWRRTRAAWLACVVALHVGIGFGMGMWLFAWVMVLLNAVAFGDTSYAWVRRRAAQFGLSGRGVRRRLSPGVSDARESTFQATEAQPPVPLRARYCPAIARCRWRRPETGPCRWALRRVRALGDL